jgi:hypothetical protein
MGISLVSFVVSCLIFSLKMSEEDWENEEAHGLKSKWDDEDEDDVKV